MNTKSLLIVTALIEVGTGIVLAIIPSAVVELLLGAGLSSRQSLVLGRVAGAALISIGVMCWLARNDSRTGAQTGPIIGALIYNISVPTLLTYSAIVSTMHGIALWPASLLHIGLAIWCIFCLRSS